MSDTGFMAAIRKLLGGQKKPQRPSRTTLPMSSSLPDLPRGAEVKYIKEHRVTRSTSVALDKDRRRRRVIWAAIGAGVLLVPALAIVLINILWQTTIPPELTGTWRTNEPRYANRRFELLDDQVVFQVGDSAQAVERYVVSRVRRSRSPRGPLYRVQYASAEGALFQFSFVFDNGVIRFANQANFTWSRTGPPSPKPRIGDL